MKAVGFILIGSWLVLSFYYYTIHVGVYTIPIEEEEDYIVNENDSYLYLINTPRCAIPNFMRTIKISETKPLKKSCGKREIFVERLGDNNILFKINKNKIKAFKKCCYKFLKPAKIEEKEDYRKISYSQCSPFKNGTIVPLQEEIVEVSCTTVPVYQDAYIFVKKVKKTEIKKKHFWNVLLIGMDTMSRARAFHSMPKTTQYFQQHKWLDFKGYHKVGSNTFPNIAAMMTGKAVDIIERACYSGMDNCSKQFLWSVFESNGFATAYGEDFLSLPDTFSRYNGFIKKPTDHYLRPLFLIGERIVGNLLCTKNTASAKYILDYASDFAEIYRDDGFFGFFWINSHSHQSVNNPSLFEKDVIDFFETLSNTSVLNNTFVFFISDHGIRFGNMRTHSEYYFEERLPMFFLWVPPTFKEDSPNQFKNMITNQYRLITPYDIYLTMSDILNKSNKSSPILKSDACPKCRAIFKQIPAFRTCEDAGISEKWCSCHTFSTVNEKDSNAQRSIQLVVKSINEKAKSIKTKICTKCMTFTLSKVFRVHTFKNEYLNKTYYVVALGLHPGDVRYETTVVGSNGNFSILGPTYPITAYNNNGYCVQNPLDRPYCTCKKVKCENKYKL